MALNCERWLIARGKELKSSAYRKERQLMIGVLKAAERDGIILAQQHQFNDGS